MNDPLIHFANTAVEQEICQYSSNELLPPLKIHPHALQLQFLPLLYGAPQDVVVVSTFPDQTYLDQLSHHPFFLRGIPQLTRLDQPIPHAKTVCLPWGHAPSIEKWAKKNHILYHFPSDWEKVKEVHSKAWSFQFSDLKDAAIIGDEQSLKKWLAEISGLKVLKTCYGLSGQGNLVFDQSTPFVQVLQFCRQEWKQNRVIIAEPWLKRVEDFSTQWIIHPSGTIDFLGATRFEIHGKGTYLGTWAGPESLLFSTFTSFLNQHKEQALMALDALYKEGYFGPVGVDAFIYELEQQLALHAIVEINPRQTMSSIALQMQKRLAPKKMMKLSFTLHPTTHSFLPLSLIDENNKKKDFRRHLNLEII